MQLVMIGDKHKLAPNKKFTFSNTVCAFAENLKHCTVQLVKICINKLYNLAAAYTV